jgi:hypothetical protein
MHTRASIVSIGNSRCSDPLDNHNFNEKLGDVAYDDPSYNWVRGPAEDFPGYQDNINRYWFDDITVYNDTDNCGGFF